MPRLRRRQRTWLGIATKHSSSIRLASVAALLAVRAVRIGRAATVAAVVAVTWITVFTTRVGAQASNPRRAFAADSATPAVFVRDTNSASHALTYQLGAMGVLAVTHAVPGVLGQNMTEGYLTQPNIMGRAQRGSLALTATVNFEGFTLDRGELNAGIYGEGYVDRRHPHTFVHEVMLSLVSPSVRGVRASLAAGKGFTPYGTDDPMMRPLEKFPVNHHHAQIIERIQTVAALRAGSLERSVVLEHAFFNGDEPIDPFMGPQWKRFGDSRATRLTVMPWRGVEVQASRAFVRSPGITQGGAFDHTQTSASFRVDRITPASTTGHTDGHAVDHTTDALTGAMDHRTMQSGNRRYFLMEVARTDEGYGASRVFRFNSMLAEGVWSQRGWSIAVRGERTDRPESERLLNPFRIANGHIDFQLIGITQWSVTSLQAAAPAYTIPYLPQSGVTPFLEVSNAHAKALRTPAVFEPRTFYGASSLWSVTFGLRVHVGTMAARMGRYGVLHPTSR